MVPREKIDDVRERTNIVEVVKRHVELKRAGTASWKGLCPFHAEKTPSFHVHESRQFFHCFGCGEKGDVFTFATKIEQRSFMEVLRDLSRDAGVELPEKQLSPAERQAMAAAESEKERMLRAVELATRFFETSLASPAGAAAREYLASRGISEATQTRFRLGYAPAAWDALQRHLAANGIPLPVAEQLGLVGANERGTYDFFRDRVMLPVLDRQKRPVGYSSRLLDPNAKDRKYVNSPDSPLFHKKEQLYGLHTALDAIRRSGVAVVVEGNFDVLALHEAGIAEAVAPMGTALTTEQIAQLGRMADRVVVVFDGDAAGERAARKSVPIFVEGDVDGRVARMPAGIDPDDFVRREGAEAFRKLTEAARPAVEHLIDELSREAEPTVPGRLKVMEEAAPILAKVKNPTARELYVTRLASALGLAPAQALRAVRAAAGGRPTRAAGDTPPAAAPSAPVSRQPEPLELEPVALLVACPHLAKMPQARRVLDLLTDESMRRLYRTALEPLERGERLDVPAWLEAGPDDVRYAVSRTVMDGRYDKFEGAERALRSLTLRLEQKRLESEIAEFTKALNASGDPAARTAILERTNQLIRTKHELRKAP